MCSEYRGVCLQVGQHLEKGGHVNKDDFKVVYVAPMKALAAEITATFSRRLQPLGLPALFAWPHLCCKHWLHCRQDCTTA